MRPISTVAPEWWDYTTLDGELLGDAARLTAEDLPGLARPGFSIQIYDTVEDFYLAEALEYIDAWRQATPDNPVGICGHPSLRSSGSGLGSHGREGHDRQLDHRTSAG